MATTCTNCGCGPKKCGCQDTMLTSPAPCPTPVGCPTPAPCSEAFDAQCVIYTGENILCGDDIVVSQDMSAAEAFEAITTYFCTATSTIANDILCGQDVVVTAGTSVQDAIIAVVDYFCSAIGDTGWVDLEGFSYYSGSMAANRPQVRRIGKQLHFRGNLYVPLSNGTSIINLTGPDTYETVTRKTPFVGAGGVYVDASDNLFFNSTGSAAGVVIPTSVLPGGTTLDGDYKLQREIATRRFVVSTSDQQSALDGFILLHAYLEVSITSAKTLKLTTLETLENDTTYPAVFTGSSSLRTITSSFNPRARVINFDDYLFGQDGTNSTNQSIITGGGLIVGRMYYINNYLAGDDFTNVGAGANTAGVTFVATGVTPTTWTNGSTLIAIPQSVHSRGLFFLDPVATTTAAAFPALLDGGYLDAAKHTDVGGFVISLDGLTAFVQ